MHKPVGGQAGTMYYFFDITVCRLQGEHGTGRNVAPFVEMEWGTKAYDLMWELKALFDPNFVLNPGVVLNKVCLAQPCLMSPTWHAQGAVCLTLLAVCGMLRQSDRFCTLKKDAYTAAGLVTLVSYIAHQVAPQGTQFLLDSRTVWSKVWLRQLACSQLLTVLTSSEFLQDPDLHVKHLKPSPAASSIVNRCIECGFCESNCPSRDITLTPRQRITTYREISRLRDIGERTDAQQQRLTDFEKSYDYDGDATCAADGMCQVKCPVKINTGELIKQLRSDELEGGDHPRATKGAMVSIGII